MAGGNTAFDQFIADEVKKYKGVYAPVKAGILRRALIRWAPCDRLHPNPDDEFCSPKVGPNYRIISEYMNSFRLARHHTKQYCEEPLIVEKIRPDGYLILNGHHRWAAALRLGFSRITPSFIFERASRSIMFSVSGNSGQCRQITSERA